MDEKASLEGRKAKLGTGGLIALGLIAWAWISRQPTTAAEIITPVEPEEPMIPPVSPAITLKLLMWDAESPFEIGAQHNWSVIMENLASGSLIYRFEMYMNGQRFGGYTANLATDEIRGESQPYTFRTAGTYTLTVKAYYGGELLDEISSTINVRVPPAPDIINGEILVAHVWWEGLDPRKQITSDNTWPASQPLTISYKIKNTGNVAADFHVGNAFGVSNTITLAPGESGLVQQEGAVWYDKGLIMIAFTLYADNESVFVGPTIRINFV